MSLVEAQPSTVIELNVGATAARRIACEHRWLGGRVGREHGEHRRHVRGEHRRALGHPTDGEQPPPVVDPATTASLRTVSVVMIASAAARPDASLPARPSTTTPTRAFNRCQRERHADEAGLADQHLRRRAAHPVGHQLTEPPSSIDPRLPGRRVGVARRQHDCRCPPTGLGQVGPADLDRGRSGQVGREHAGGRYRAPIVGGDDGQIRRAGRLDANRSAGGDESFRRGDAHGCLLLTGTGPSAGARSFPAGRGRCWRTGQPDRPPP